ncbi:hypothetical protein FTX61_05385 [Nitriliruptoraceae bacterium ZYF776]|nr:hypothetical protein [Profundirhabdus halotolerans]
MSERPELPPLRDDGLPTLPTGEPVLARWFTVLMLALAPVAIGVTVWAFLSIPDGEIIGAAERRPAGDAEVTVTRGEAQLNPVDEVASGPGCARTLRVVGDEGARAAGDRALEATCELFTGGRFEEALAGLRDWQDSTGDLRFATFQMSGVESSGRVEDGRLVIELNARFQFEDAATAAPAILGQLVLFGADDWPGATPTAQRALLAAEVEDAACGVLFDDITAEGVPRGCRDVAELLADDDPIEELVAAGYRDDGADEAGASGPHGPSDDEERDR